MLGLNFTKIVWAVVMMIRLTLAAWLGQPWTFMLMFFVIWVAILLGNFACQDDSVPGLSAANAEAEPEIEIASDEGAYYNTAFGPISKDAWKKRR